MEKILGEYTESHSTVVGISMVYGILPNEPIAEQKSIASPSNLRRDSLDDLDCLKVDFP